MNSKSNKQQSGPLRLLWRHTVRKKARGQAIVVVALALLLLIAVVGLAVDGGATYALRRKAQNASDGAALAAGRLMLKYYDQMVLLNPNGDVPSNNVKEDAVRQTITDYIIANGVNPNTVKAYFVNANKEIVTVHNGEDHGQGQCGSAFGSSRPCQIGLNDGIPWQLGILGVTLISTAQTDSIFAGALGWNTLTGEARSSAFILVNTISGDINVQPIAIFRRPENYEEFRFGQTYTLLDGNVTQGGGQWGWIDWNGQSSSRQAILDLINCGFNPSSTHEQWVARCPGTQTNGEGPTRHFTSTLPATTYLPHPAPMNPGPRYLKYGPAMSGWWVGGSSGSPTSSCRDFWDRVNRGGEYDGLREGVYLFFPIFDKTHDVGGASGLRFHLRQIVKFFVGKPVGTYNNPSPADDVSCTPVTPPAPTPCPVGTVCPTPTPLPSGGGGNIKWFIRGKAISFYDNAASGELGDLRSSLGHTVTLDR